MFEMIAANQLSANQIVNSVANYIYKHLDGAYKIEKGVNQRDVYSIVLYQVKDPLNKVEHKEMYEMNLDINITTYQNKIRINVIEISPEEVTITCDVWKPETFDNMNEAYKKILGRISAKISKRYEEYDFLF